MTNDVEKSMKEKLEKIIFNSVYFKVDSRESMYISKIG